MAWFGTRMSQRVRAFPASASRRMVAVCQTVSPSGMRYPISFEESSHSRLALAGSSAYGATPAIVVSERRCTTGASLQSSK